MERTTFDKGLVIALPYIGKLSLQILTRTDRVMKSKPHTVKPVLFHRLSTKFVGNSLYIQRHHVFGSTFQHRLYLSVWCLQCRFMRGNKCQFKVRISS